MNARNQRLTEEIAFEKEYSKAEYKHHPDREILTMLGCQILIQCGAKAVKAKIDKGMPFFKAGQSYRFVRKGVMQWLEDDSDGK